MHSAPQSRNTLKISDSLNRQLSPYAQVAAAAGVSVLALGGASEAEVVYTETHQVTGSSFPLYIDLNHDGINDFVLRATYYAGRSGFEIGLDASGIARNRVARKRAARFTDPERCGSVSSLYRTEVPPYAVPISV